MFRFMVRLRDFYKNIHFLDMIFSKISTFCKVLYAYPIFIKNYTRAHFFRHLRFLFFFSSVVFFFILHHFRIAAFSYFIIFFLFFNFSVGTIVLLRRRPSFKFQLPLLYSSTSAAASITITATATFFDD